MKWYWHQAGGHTHVRVFFNGAKCGDLCFRNEEFQSLRAGCLLVTSTAWLIEFIDDAIAFEMQPEKEGA